MKRIIYFFTAWIFLFQADIGAQTNIVGYEYWFNDDYNAKTVTSTIPTEHFLLNEQFPAAHLHDGFHRLNIRFLDDHGAFSSTFSYFFFKRGNSSASPINDIVSYEYWFDQDFNSKTAVSVSPVENLNLNSLLSAVVLSPGLHTFHIRFMDTAEQWSSVLSTFFFKQNSQSGATTGISEYEYWFDDDYDSAVNTSITLTEQLDLNTLIPTDQISPGIHILNIRFRDSAGQWSSVLSSFFMKQNNQSGSFPVMEEVQYWFDNDFASAVQITLPGDTSVLLDMAIPAASLQNGLHAIHIRLKDSSGQWSSILSKFFHKNGSQLNNIPNLVAEYRYWFDQDPSTMQNVSLSSPVNPLDLTTNIDMTRIWKGIHQFHIQFRDTIGQWSSVLCQTVEKLPYPIAEFAASSQNICVGDTVFFTNTSMDGDTHFWDFGDGNYSNDSSVYHVFNTPGLMNVSLTVTDTTVLLDSTIVIPVYVGNFASPVLTFNPNDSICFGSATEIHAENGVYDYFWSTGDTTQFVTVSQSGQFWVTISDQNNTSCQVQSDSVTVTVIDLPMIDLGSDIMQVNPPAVLDAGPGFTQYDWNTGQHTQTISVTVSGTYSVTVTNSFGCQNSDSVNVTFTAGLIENDNLQSLFTVFPNPAYDYIIVSSVTLPFEDYIVSIYDIYGKKIIETVFSADQKFASKTINISHISSGYYKILLYSDSLKASKTLIIQR
jgi:hypothetical protein